MSHDLVLVVNYGAKCAQLAARRVREAHVYSEIVPSSTPVADIIARKPKAVILSGSERSIFDDGAPDVDPALFDAGIPVLGLGYGYRLMVRALGGRLRRAEKPEPGYTTLRIEASRPPLAGVPHQSKVWVEPHDIVVDAPEGFVVLGSTDRSPAAVALHPERKLCGVQWQPESSESEGGQRFVENFLFEIAGCSSDWTAASFVAEHVQAIRQQVGDKRVLCALSGGVDSAVAAALVQRAVGDQLTCVFVDHGLLRKGEAEQVREDFVASTGVKLIALDEEERFLTALKGVTDPEEKRKIIGREFIRTFEAAARDIAGNEGIDFLVQGTLYPDVVESGGDGAKNIKSHHNVGGLPDDLKFTLIEPLRDLFKDEVRSAGMELGLPDAMVWRHPFPGPGLGVRIIGELTRERLDILREADAIVREELAAAQLDRQVWQMPVVLLADVRSVGTDGEERTYGYPVVLRPVYSEDAMTAQWAQLPHDLIDRMSSRITLEVPEINRVVLDVSNKPPATIEWE